MLIPNFNTLADAIDRLIVEVGKLAWYENAKREESLKANPDAQLIAKLDKNSRDCCEYRDLLKREIDKIFATAIETKKYETLPANRTFSPPTNPVSDIIAEMVFERVNEENRKKLVEALKSLL